MHGEWNSFDDSSEPKLCTMVVFFFFLIVYEWKNAINHDNRRSARASQFICSDITVLAQHRFKCKGLHSAYSLHSLPYDTVKKKFPFLTYKSGDRGAVKLLRVNFPEIPHVGSQNVMSRQPGAAFSSLPRVFMEQCCCQSKDRVISHFTALVKLSKTFHNTFFFAVY